MCLKTEYLLKIWLCGLHKGYCREKFFDSKVCRQRKKFGRHCTKGMGVPREWSNEVWTPLNKKEKKTCDLRVAKTKYEQSF